MSEKIQIWLQSTSIALAPGSNGYLEATITNASEVLDRFDLQLLNLSPDWYEIAPPSLNLLPHESGTSRLIIHPQADAQAGNYPCLLRATSGLNSAEQTTIPLAVQVNLGGGYSLHLAPTLARISATATFTVTVTNSSNAPLALQLAAHDSAGKGAYSLQPAALSLAPGKDAQATLQVTLLEAPTFPESIVFSLVATPDGSPGDTQSVDGQLELSPSQQAFLRLVPEQVSDARVGQYTVHIINPGANEVRLRLEGEDPEAACRYLFDPAEVTVPAGGEVQSQLLVEAQTWHEGEVPREYSFTVRGLALKGTAESLQPTPASGKLMQASRPPLAIQLVPRVASGSRRARFQARLSSTRPEPATLQISALDPADALKFEISPASVELRSGSEVVSNLKVTCKDSLPRGEKRRVLPFTVSATPVGGEPVQVQGRFAQTPSGLPLPKDPNLRRLLIIILCLLGLFACIIATLVIAKGCGNGTPTPQVMATPACPSTPIAVVAVTPMQVVAEPATPTKPGPTPTLPPASPVPKPAVPAQLSGGFFDLPFPYDGGTTNFGGTDEQFRRAANRATLGGWITSYFDHEYPLFPWQFQGLKLGGNEPSTAPVGSSVLAFDGERLDADWYTGHPGYDFAPPDEISGDIPIFAPADGMVYEVTILPSGNHLVELLHAVPGVGNYLTLFEHLRADDYWQATKARVGQVIRAGERIGTMGNTGKSTGTHLHFEVLFDANGDGEFSAQERVDPFGFVPMTGPDPWSEPVTIHNPQGGSFSHAGVTSLYLWSHPLGVTAEVGSEPVLLELSRGGEEISPLTSCAPANSFESGTTLVVGWSPDPPPNENQIGTNNGCLVGAFQSDGKPLAEFVAPVQVSMHFTMDDIRNVDHQTLAIYLLNSDTGVWEALPTTIDLTNQTATALFPRPGKCSLMGKPVNDVLAPHTTITLEGGRDASGGFTGDVTVILNAVDIGASGVQDTQYSLDYGTTWL
ncbi:MAG: peptidoglycan DD-metalloendopeptidase family protein [Anaerolineae bacterium]